MSNYYKNSENGNNALKQKTIFSTMFCYVHVLLHSAAKQILCVHAQQLLFKIA
jgi:hypothetical protein